MLKYVPRYLIQGEETSEGIFRMSDDARIGDVIGHIQRRLLVNSLADPAEVATRLPTGLRPHVGANGGTIVGCCMIEIDAARPWPMPSAVGISIRAAAHRISVDVDHDDKDSVGVFVPGRQTDSTMAIFAGGRLFPGVHERATIDITNNAWRLSWDVTTRTTAFDIQAIAHYDGPTARACADTADADKADRADAHRVDISASAIGTEIADIVLGTTLGLSPGRAATTVDRVQMVTSHQRANLVTVSTLRSAFIDSFSSAVPAPALLMTDVDVVWKRDAETA